MLKINRLGRALAFNDFVDNASWKQANQALSPSQKQEEVQKKNVPSIRLVKRKQKKSVK